MKKKIFLNYKILAGFLLVLPIMAVMAVSCRNDVREIETPGEELIEFIGKIKDEGKVATRLDTTYVNSYQYNTNFYIEMDVEGETAPIFGTYEVPSGYEGRLNAIQDQKPLMWQDLQADHTFYAWTIPWDDEYSPTTETVKVTFENSSEADGYESNKNNQILEKFIGAKAGPYSYVKNGKYVDLTFHHLVSKIKIGTFQLIESKGGANVVQKNLKADVTFIGMPTKATFFPHPEDDGRPYVQPSDPDENEGITYYIANDAAGSDVFYICPEVDFGKVNFQVRLKNEEYQENKIDVYYGTFDDVVFERTEGNDYDKGDGSDDKVLHAGEMMTLNITLIPGIGPGLSIIIDKWSTEAKREPQYHTYPGLYSDAEVKGLIDIFSEMSDNNFCEKVKEIERLFELYGSDDETNNEMIFYLYENVNYDSNIFPIYKAYILNGMGHVITMKTNYGDGGGAFGGNTNYFNIGPARDVYLSNSNGTIKLYIDAQGFVWTYNSDTNQYTKTENQLTELTGYEKSYDIDTVTGKVRKSNYFNNPLGEYPKDFPDCSSY